MFVILPGRIIPGRANEAAVLTHVLKFRLSHIESVFCTFSHTLNTWKSWSWQHLLTGLTKLEFKHHPHKKTKLKLCKTLTLVTTESTFTLQLHREVPVTLQWFCHTVRNIDYEKKGLEIPSVSKRYTLQLGSDQHKARCCWAQAKHWRDQRVSSQLPAVARSRKSQSCLKQDSVTQHG